MAVKWPYAEVTASRCSGVGSSPSISTRSMRARMTEDLLRCRRGALPVWLLAACGRHRVAERQEERHREQDRQEDQIDGDLGDVLELRGQPGHQAGDEVLHRFCEHHASPSDRATSYRRLRPGRLN